MMTEVVCKCSALLGCTVRHVAGGFLELQTFDSQESCYIDSPLSARSRGSRRELLFVWFRFDVRGTIDIDANLYVLP